MKILSTTGNILEKKHGYDEKNGVVRRYYERYVSEE